MLKSAALMLEHLCSKLYRMLKGHAMELQPGGRSCISHNSVSSSVDSISSCLIAGKGPLQNLNDHLANPPLNNGFAAATKFTP